MTTSADHVVVLDEDTPDYYGSDVSSAASGIPDGLNDVSVEEPWEESDTDSSTAGLPDGFNDRATDDHIGPDPAAIAQSVGDGGGGDQAPDGPNTDIAGNESAYDGSEGSNEGSSTAEEGPSGASGGDGGSEAEEEPERASMTQSHAELQQMARDNGVDDSGTKAELVERINAKLDA